MFPKKRFIKRLRLERLESRCMLSAGNVTAKVIGGSLFLQSDTGNDSVTVAGTATPGWYTVTGNSGTTINGGGPFTAKGVTNDLNANFLNGNDSLAFNSATTNPYIHNVIVVMGNGSDSVSMGKLGSGGGVSIGGDVNVVLGNGSSDSVNVGNGSTSSSVGGSVNINLGSGGSDHVYVGDIMSSSTSISVGGSVNTNLGGGANDYVYVGDATTASIGGSVNTNLGGGNNDYVYVGDSGTETMRRQREHDPGGRQQ